MSVPVVTQLVTRFYPNLLVPTQAGDLVTLRVVDDQAVPLRQVQDDVERLAAGSN
jgi:hypothetical protein